MHTKIRLIQLGMRQNELIKPLADKGLTVNTAELCLAINGKGTQDKHKKILEAVNEILTEMEGE